MSEFFFRWAERCLYDYPANVERLERLRENLRRMSSMPVQNYQPGKKSGTTDPVGRYVERVMELEEEITRLESRVAPVERLLGKLALGPALLRDMAKILALRYWEKRTWPEIAEETGLAERTLFRRRELIVKWACKALKDGA